jgi:G3E family GTPase
MIVSTCGLLVLAKMDNITHLGHAIHQSAYVASWTHDVDIVVADDGTVEVLVGHGCVREVKATSSLVDPTTAVYKRKHQHHSRQTASFFIWSHSPSRFGSFFELGVVGVGMFEGTAMVRDGGCKDGCNHS